MNARDFRNIMLGAVVAVSGLSALAAIELTSFVPGTPIKSAEINANFSSLKAAVEAPIGASKLETTGKAADGKVLKLAGGNLTWSDDLLGSAGSTYSADGSSLALTDTTFSIKDAGVSSAKLALPLLLNKSSPSPILAVVNTNGHGLLAVSGKASLNGSPSASIGVWGDSQSGYGIVGTSTSSFGVVGRSASSAGVQGSSESGPGVSGSSSTDVGVQASSSSGIAVYGQSSTGKSAYFSGGSGGSGSCTFNGGAGWVCTSDRNKKENFKTVNAQAMLEKLARMPVTRWNMKGDRNKTLHIGPVAQDFKAAFGLGENDTTINTADAQGVAFAAIKGMYAKNQVLEKQVKTLEARLIALENGMRSR